MDEHVHADCGFCRARKRFPMTLWKHFVLINDFKCWECNIGEWVEQLHEGCCFAVRK